MTKWGLDKEENRRFSRSFRKDLQRLLRWEMIISLIFNPEQIMDYPFRGWVSKSLPFDIACHPERVFLIDMLPFRNKDHLTIEECF